jgi:hypothetical protein
MWERGRGEGFVILRFTNAEVSNDLDSVLMRIGEAAILPATVHPYPQPLSRPEEGGEP